MSDWKEEHKERERLRALEVLEKEKILSELFNKYPQMSIEIEFSCGGDSMNDLYLNEDSLPEKMPKIERDVLKDIVEEIIHDKVDFYVDSDGHYCGESGRVVVGFEEGELTWDKEAESEYSERICINPKVNLETEGFTQKEIDYLEDVLAVVFYSHGDNVLTFKKDLVIFEEDREIIDRFSSLIKRLFEGETFHEEAVEEGRREFSNFEANDDTTLSTREDLGEDSIGLQIEGKILTLSYELFGYVYVTSE